MENLNEYIQLAESTTGVEADKFDKHMESARQGVNDNKQVIFAMHTDARIDRDERNISMKSSIY